MARGLAAATAAGILWTVAISLLANLSRNERERAREASQFLVIVLERVEGVVGARCVDHEQWLRGASEPSDLGTCPQVCT